MNKENCHVRDCRNTPGEEKVKDLLLEGLRRLEYRGYDSPGMALHEEQIEIHKERKLKSRGISEINMKRLQACPAGGPAHGEPSRSERPSHAGVKAIVLVHVALSRTGNSEIPDF